MSNEFLFRDSPANSLDVKDAKGSYVIDQQGKSYLDFMMGWCVGNAGWKKKELRSIIKKFNGPEYVTPTYQYDRWEVLAKKLVSLLPSNDYTCFRATGGTEAVEIALKTAKAYNHRQKFIAFKDAYHGQSFAAMSLVKLHEDKFGPYSANFIQIEPVNWEQTTQQVVEMIEKNEICAFISEPLICNLGVIVPPSFFYEKIYAACQKTNTLFICDEVATGFGRTGKWFGFEHYGLEPDIIVVAKGFSSGYGGIGATIAKRKVAESMRFGFSNYSTFGWHPFATEAAIANIDYLQHKKLVEQSAKMGVYLMKKLSKFCKPRGAGLCVGFSVNQSDFQSRCQQDGLLLSSFDGFAVLFPALDVKKSEIDHAVQIIEKNI